MKYTLGSSPLIIRILSGFLAPSFTVLGAVSSASITSFSGIFTSQAERSPGETDVTSAPLL